MLSSVHASLQLTGKLYDFIVAVFGKHYVCSILALLVVLMLLVLLLKTVSRLSFDASQLMRDCCTH
jgi:uncharacterized membrane protein